MPQLHPRILKRKVLFIETQKPCVCVIYNALLRQRVRKINFTMKKTNMMMKKRIRE